MQLAKRAGAVVIATASLENDSYVRRLGADGVIDYRARRFEERVKGIDAVIDTVGGKTLDRSYEILKRGGIRCSPWCSRPRRKPSSTGYERYSS